jgi:hypothetical protein
MLRTMRSVSRCYFAVLSLTPVQNPISPEILRVVASRVQANDRNDHLLLSPETEEVGPYELPLPREVSGLGDVRTCIS